MMQPKIDNEYLRILLGDAIEMLERARGSLINTDLLEPEEIIKQTNHDLDQARLRIDFVQGKLKEGEQ